MATPAPSRSHFPPRQPKLVSDLSRAQLCGRITALRAALTALAEQSDMDGAGVFECVGSMKRHLIALEQMVRDRDAAEPAMPFAAAVNEGDARARLEAAHAELAALQRAEAEDGLSHDQMSRLVRLIAETGARSLAGGAR